MAVEAKISDPDVATELKAREFVEAKAISVKEVNGVTFSQNKINELVDGIMENKISEKSVSDFMDTVVDKHLENRLHWADKEEPTKSGVVSTLKNQKEKPIAYVLERTNRETNEKFYVGKEIPTKEQDQDTPHKDLFIGSDLDKVKETIDKIYVSRTCSLVKKGVDNDKSMTQQVKERGVEL